VHTSYNVAAIVLLHRIESWVALERPYFTRQDMSK
jgi:hypothetical protein